MHEIDVEPPRVPVGMLKSFGPCGPIYEVGEVLRQLEDGDWLVEITMLRSGAKSEYRFTYLCDDPQAD